MDADEENSDCAETSVCSGPTETLLLNAVLCLTFLLLMFVIL